MSAKTNPFIAEARFAPQDLERFAAFQLSSEVNRTTQHLCEVDGKARRDCGLFQSRKERALDYGFPC